MRQRRAKSNNAGTKKRLSPTVTVSRCPTKLPGDDVPEPLGGVPAGAAPCPPPPRPDDDRPRPVAPVNRPAVPAAPPPAPALVAGPVPPEPGVPFEPPEPGPAVPVILAIWLMA